MKRVFSLKRSLLAAAVLTSVVTGSVSATPNTSRYTMSVTGNTASVNVVNSEQIDSVEARFSYTGDVNSFNITVKNGSSFGTCIDPRQNGIACSNASALAPGSYRVATISFAPKAGVTKASITVSTQSTSSVLMPPAPA